MRVDKRQSGNVIILTPLNTFFTSKDTELQRAIESEIGNGSRAFVINLAGIHSMDSSGLGELVALKKKVELNGGSAVLCEPTTQVAKLIKISKLDTLFDIHKTENESIRSFM